MESPEVVEWTRRLNYGTWRHQKSWSPLHVVGALAAAGLLVLASSAATQTRDAACSPTATILQSPRANSWEVQAKALNDRSDIVGFADRGRGTRVHAILWMGAMLALEHLGLDPDRDKIAIINAGDQTVLAQAIANGTIDATVLDGVQSRPLHAKGLTILAELDKARLPILSSSIVARA